GEAIYFAPNCETEPTNCADKTVIFDIDQGFTGGLQNLARTTPSIAASALDRMISTFHRVQKRYKVAVILNPIQESREATLAVLDRLAGAGIPFILDEYSSDVTNLAYVKKNWIDYKARAADPLKGVSLNPEGLTSSSDSLDFYANRYGDMFLGVRI